MAIGWNKLCHPPATCGQRAVYLPICEWATLMILYLIGDLSPYIALLLIFYVNSTAPIS